jgi:hypothetical protein
MLSLCVLTVVPVVAIVAMRALGLAQTAADTGVVGGLALCCATVIGLPALRWAIEHDRTRIWSLALIGAVAGTVPPLLALVSGTIGLGARGGLDYVRWVFEHGASIPWYGIRRWSQFLVETGACAAIGAVSGAVLALAVPGFRGSGVPRFAGGGPNSSRDV